MMPPALAIGPHRIDPPLVLAPMAGVTDKPFRRLCKDLGAGLAVSEMTTSDPKLWSTRKSLHRMDHAGEPAPVAVQIAGATMGVNYGLNKVRFPAPVPVGSRVRARVGVQAVEPVGPDSVQITWLVTVEREGSDKPVCVAESLSRSYGAVMGALA